MQTVIEILLHRRRIQHRYTAGFQNMFTLVRGGRRFGGMIVAGQYQHAAMLRAACHVRMLEYIAAAIDARPLAVPHREHAVVLRTGKQVDLLRAPYAGSRQVLVDAGMELYLMCVEML